MATFYHAEAFVRPIAYLLQGYIMSKREASKLWWVIMLRHCWYATCCPSRCSM